MFFMLLCRPGILTKAAADKVPAPSHRYCPIFAWAMYNIVMGRVINKHLPASVHRHNSIMCQLVPILDLYLAQGAAAWDKARQGQQLSTKTQVPFDCSLPKNMDMTDKNFKSSIFPLMHFLLQTNLFKTDAQTNRDDPKQYCGSKGTEVYTRHCQNINAAVKSWEQRVIPMEQLTQNKASKPLLDLGTAAMKKLMKWGKLLKLIQKDSTPPYEVVDKEYASYLPSRVPPPDAGIPGQPIGDARYEPTPSDDEEEVKAKQRAKKKAEKQWGHGREGFQAYAHDTEGEEDKEEGQGVSHSHADVPDRDHDESERERERLLGDRKANRKTEKGIAALTIPREKAGGVKLTGPRAAQQVPGMQASKGYVHAFCIADGLGVVSWVFCDTAHAWSICLTFVSIMSNSRKERYSHKT